MLDRFSGRCSESEARLTSSSTNAAAWPTLTALVGGSALLRNIPPRQPETSKYDCIAFLALCQLVMCVVYQKLLFIDLSRHPLSVGRDDSDEKPPVATHARRSASLSQVARGILLSERYRPHPLRFRLATKLET